VFFEQDEPVWSENVIFPSSKLNNNNATLRTQVDLVIGIKAY